MLPSNISRDSKTAKQTLVRSSKDMADRVKTLINERKQSKLKINDLESQITDLKQRLHTADKKTAVTASVGQRKINSLSVKIDDLE